MAQMTISRKIPELHFYVPISVIFGKPLKKTMTVVVVPAIVNNCTHINVASLTLIYPNPNPNQKKISNLRPEILTLFGVSLMAERDGGRRPYKKG